MKVPSRLQDNLDYLWWFIWWFELQICSSYRSKDETRFIWESRKYTLHIFPVTVGHQAFLLGEPYYPIVTPKDNQ